ncbi:MAG TPA: hypothetical protein VHT30_03545 [Acidimicrobiales bacterium]|jgi:hypothetical protein|nr:hypothetical protein [Acidimicrobiales bacterium]
MVLVLKLAVGLVGFWVIIRIGLFFLRAFATPMPKLASGELRRVNLKYQCVVCGAEVRMTKAGEDLPPPPRHCLEDMQLVSPVE